MVMLGVLLQLAAGTAARLGQFTGADVSASDAKSVRVGGIDSPGWRYSQIASQSLSSWDYRLATAARYCRIVMNYPLIARV